MKPVPVDHMFSQVFGVCICSPELLFAPEKASQDRQPAESVVVLFKGISSDDDAQDTQPTLSEIITPVVTSPENTSHDISLPELTGNPPENVVSSVVISAPSPVVRVCS